MKKLKTIALVIVSCLVLTGCGCQKEAEKYTVSFNSNGGSAVVNQVVEDGKTVSKPADPTREGYTFAGWYTSEDATQAYDFSKGVTGNLTLTARWTKGPVSEVCTKTCGAGYTLQNPDSKDCKCVKDSTNTTPSKDTKTSDNKNTKPSNNTGTNTKPVSGNVAVTALSLSNTSITLTQKGTATITAGVGPANATNKTVTWSSSNTSVATVDANGKVTAVGVGTAVISAKAGDLTATCNVTVKAATYTYENKGTPAGFADVQVGIAVYDASGKDVTSTVTKLVDAEGYYLGEYNSSAKLVVVNKNEASLIAKVVISGQTYDIKAK